MTELQARQAKNARNLFLKLHVGQLKKPWLTCGDSRLYQFAVHRQVKNSARQAVDDPLTLGCQAII
ncbi:hypothetical protein SSYIS1_11890 [Serratia symbiotica]|uniref:Uncharacterized protein n=1 Tax=Serratia symbiotica TaxID=138074 RepID=A0A455VPA1_9GAMM|nr:hypothetical protein SSYIS1_11890 [Serratia symbiotica]